MQHGLKLASIEGLRNLVFARHSRSCDVLLAKLSQFNVPRVEIGFVAIGGTPFPQCLKQFCQPYLGHEGVQWSKGQSGGLQANQGQAFAKGFCSANPCFRPKYVLDPSKPKQMSLMCEMFSSTNSSKHTRLASSKKRWHELRDTLEHISGFTYEQLAKTLAAWLAETSNRKVFQQKTLTFQTH